MREGDILLAKGRETYRLAKILRIASFPDGSATAHVMLYQNFSSRPSLEDLDSATVEVWHAPIALEAMERDSEVIGNRPVQTDELAGYWEYLKQTDFNTYLAESGRTAEDVIAEAKSAYDEGNRLCNENNFDQAILAYAHAIATAPFFVEAHDNRAFALMDLGRFEEAAAGFEESLCYNADNPVALFSRGECFLRLREFDRAAQIFRECVNRWPEQPHHKEFLQRAQAAGAITKPLAKKRWWQFW